MNDNILVPVDGSQLSRRALEITLEEYPDSEIHALHVIDPTEPGYSVADVAYRGEIEPRHGSAEWYDRANELGEDVLEDARELAADHDVDLETETVVGRPDREILQYAEREGIDHIVMGSHGRGEDSSILLGSVTEAVAFRAPVRVSLIR